MTPTDTHHPSLSPAPLEVIDALRCAAAKIAPLWPLGNFVAVNPYLGLTDRPFDEVAALLARTAGARTTLPAAFYLQAMDQGRMTHHDLARALVDHPDAGCTSVEDLVSWACDQRDTDAGSVHPAIIPTVASVATSVTGEAWERLLTNRVSAWAGGHFDAGQTMWRSGIHDEGIFEAWRFEATIDRTPEILGLTGFRSFVSSLPEDPRHAAAVALEELDVPAAGTDLYLHRLLLRNGGWSAHVARIVWDASLQGKQDDSLVEFLVVLLSWELGLFRCLPGTDLRPAWQEAVSGLEVLAHEKRDQPPLARMLALQRSFELAEQRRFIAQLNGAGLPPAATTASTGRPDAQAVFCIDVRSELFRRNLETVHTGIETIGFAGFFGMPINYVPLGHSSGAAQCPVLLTPSHTVRETIGDLSGDATEAERRRLSHHVSRAWKSFKMGAISCFGFVSPLGLAYLPKLFSDAYGRTAPAESAATEGLSRSAAATKGPDLTPDPAGTGIPFDDRLTMAEGALRAMSLTGRFAPIVLIAGHGSSTVNNPYASGLDCGACGGRTGEPNARVAARIFNDPDVRAGLADRGIAIPDGTWFIAGLHDTTTDRITVFDRERVPASHAAGLKELERHLAAAGRRARAERAPRLGIPDPQPEAAVLRRSRDWAQVRPEWGLAGCRAFIAAPRSRTAHLDLQARSFLHSYDWRADEGLSVLTTIMTAPMVVASWINLQYYASTVDNDIFGSGNKTLHNVTGRHGVLEGNAGDLRVGLPWQSVHDGDRYQHEPLRLNVVIEAPIEAMGRVLDANPAVRDLCANEWVHLLAMGDAGTVTHRYTSDGWEPVEEAATAPITESSP